LPSRHEAAGVAVLEAGLCGVPTIGTNVGYVAEWDPQGAAHAVPVGDAEALAGAILALLRAPELLAHLGAAARRLALGHNADWTASAFEAIYAEVTGSRSSARAAG
jgi:glycosyltransferase involved in cell wall biosynthesis